MDRYLSRQLQGCLRWDLSWRGIRTRALAICTIKTGAEYGSGTLKPEAGVGPDPEGLGSATRKKIL